MNNETDRRLESEVKEQRIEEAFGTQGRGREEGGEKKRERRRWMDGGNRVVGADSLCPAAFHPPCKGGEQQLVLFV